MQIIKRFLAGCVLAGIAYAYLALAVLVVYLALSFIQWELLPFSPSGEFIRILIAIYFIFSSVIAATPEGKHFAKELFES